MLDANEGAFGDTVIRIRLDEQEIAQFEWIDEGKTYREWCIPVQLVNGSNTNPHIEAPTVAHSRRATDMIFQG